MEIEKHLLLLIGLSMILIQLVEDISTGYNTNGAYGFYIGDNPEITFNDTGTGCKL